MTDKPAFGQEFSELLISRVLTAVSMREHTSADGGALLSLYNVADGSNCGALRLWAPSTESRIDRLIHCRIESPPIDTQLFFLFARPDTAVPHFHCQVVQFSEDVCVYNADIIPRLDPVDHPEYFRLVYGPVTRAYWKATGDRQNVCAMAPANPAIAALLSPWSIAAGRPTARAELERVTPSIMVYLDHCLRLVRDGIPTKVDPAVMRARDQRHLELLHSDQLDPRAWKGVYRVVGEQIGQQLKSIFGTPLQ